jgi:hypothetical protein
MSKEKNGIKYFGINQNGSASKYVFKTINIGDWNMNSTSIKSIDFGLTETQKKTIKDLNVVIRNDSDTNYYPFLSGSMEIFTNQPNENRIGPQDDLVVFTEVYSTPSVATISDLDFKLYYPITSSTPFNFYVNGTYGSSTYLSYPYSYFIPNSNGLYTLNINSSFDYGVISYYPASTPSMGYFGIANPDMPDLELFCDIIIYQNTTVLDVKTVSVGYLPLTINNSTYTSTFTSLIFDYSDQITLTLNNTEQLYIKYRFYNTGLFRYSRQIVMPGGGISTVYPSTVTYRVKTKESTIDLNNCFFSLNNDSLSSSTVSNLQSTSFFQNTNFDSTSYNRGYVTFLYKPD